MNAKDFAIFFFLITAGKYELHWSRLFKAYDVIQRTDIPITHCYDLCLSRPDCVSFSYFARIGRCFMMNNVQYPFEYRAGLPYVILIWKGDRITFFSK